MNGIFLHQFANLNPFKKVLMMNSTRKKLPYITDCILTQERNFRKSYARVLKAMKARREIAGPEKIRRRNEWSNWNYKSELYAFPLRLRENISEETLRCAFIHTSYIEMEDQKRKELDIPVQDVPLELKSNSHLVSLGHDIINNYILRFLPSYFKKLPDEGIKAIRDYLMSDKILSHVSQNIGTSDLIFCGEYPPSPSTLGTSFKAVVGSIATDNDIHRAENFVLDFLCPQLVGKDIFEIWGLENPKEVLNNILTSHGLEESEPRLIFESGRNTIESIYNVGLYTNRQFLGKGPGETLAVAEEMAAYNALRKIFHIKESEMTVYFGELARTLTYKPVEHPSINFWKSDTLAKDLNL